MKSLVVFKSSKLINQETVYQPPQEHVTPHKLSIPVWLDMDLFANLTLSSHQQPDQMMRRRRSESQQKGGPCVIGAKGLPSPFSFQIV